MTSMVDFRVDVMKIREHSEVSVARPSSPAYKPAVGAG